MATATVRGTQSFVGTLTSTWQRPSLTLLEVAWRWSFGIPALLLTLSKLKGALMAATGGTMSPRALGLDAVLLNDPVGALSADPLGATGKFAHALSLVTPEIARFAWWLVPLVMLGWVIQSSVGRTMVLRRIDPAMQVRVGTVTVLTGLRVAVLAGVFWGWFSLVGWSSRVAILQPIAQHAEPNLVLYCGLVIVVSLTIYTAWALVAWVLQIAPVLAMLEGLGVAGSLRGAMQLGALRGKLAEINLVLGIVKIALVVLAMVFSATPLPFESVTTPGFLAVWWALVGVVYLLWSDFFHVARLVGYLELWRMYAARG